MVIRKGEREVRLIFDVVLRLSRMTILRPVKAGLLQCLAACPAVCGAAGGPKKSRDLYRDLRVLRTIGNNGWSSN